MTALYNTEFTENKFKKLICAFKHTFNHDCDQTAALRNKKKAVLTKCQLILGNDSLDNEQRYGYLLLLLRAVQQSGNPVSIPFFSIYSLSAKAGLLLEKFLLDKKNIATEAEKLATTYPDATTPAQIKSLTQKIEKFVRDQSVEKAIQAVEEKLRTGITHEQTMNRYQFNIAASPATPTKQIRARL